MEEITMASPRKFTDEQRNQIVMEIIEMMTSLYSNREIVLFISEKYGVTINTTYGYIKKAEKSISHDHDDSIKDIREKHKKFLIKEIKASKGFLKASWYDRLCKLYPNELRPEVKDKGLDINVVYKKSSDE